MTAGQADALQRLWPAWGLDIDGHRIMDLGDLFGNDNPVVLEIGFGMGEATARMAAADPGTNILAYCVALGWHLQSWRGALAALAAASIPAAVIVALLSSTLASLNQLPIVQAAIAIALIVAAILVLLTAWNLLRPYLKGTNAVRTGIIAAVVVALTLMRVTPIRILLVAAVLGVVMAAPAVPTAAGDR